MRNNMSIGDFLVILAFASFIIGLAGLVIAAVIEPEPPNYLYHEDCASSKFLWFRNVTVTIYYNVTQKYLVQYVAEHGEKPPMRPVLVINRTKDILYADESFEPVKKYLEAREEYERTCRFLGEILAIIWALFFISLIAAVIIDEIKR